MCLPGIAAALLVAEGAEVWVSNPVAPNASMFQFRRDRPGTWTPVGQLVDTAAHFGAALARDGRNLVIYAPNDENGGKVVVFRHDPTTAAWAAVQRLDAQDTAAFVRMEHKSSARFGDQLAVGGEVMVVGLPFGDNMEGVAAVFTPRRGERVVAPNGHPGRYGLDHAPASHRRGDPLPPRPCPGVRLPQYRPRRVLAVERHHQRQGRPRPRAQRHLGVDGLGDRSRVRRRRPYEWDGLRRGDRSRHPRYLGELPVHPGASPSWWRDMKVYQNHAFIVSDYNAGNHGIQIFDLTQLCGVETAPAWEKSPGFAGSGSNYPYFTSGVVAVTSASEGVYLVRLREATP